MDKTQWYFTHHKMETMIQAVATMFLTKRSFCCRDYNSFFGASKAAIAAVWRHISPDISGCDDVVSTNFTIFNLFFWSITSNFFFILKINLENRFLADNGSACKMSAVGTNFKIQQPQNFKKKWFSHKFRGPGLHYVIGRCKS